MHVVLTGQVKDDHQAAELHPHDRPRSIRPVDIGRALSEAGLASGHNFERH
jgi:hypothetical protein